MEESAQRTARAEAEAMTGTMGIAWIPAIIFIIVAVGAAVVLRDVVVGAWYRFLGRSLEYENELLDQYRECMSQCLDASLGAEQRTVSCQTCDQLAERIEDYQPGLLSPIAGIAVAGGAGLAGFLGLRWWLRKGQRKALPA